MNITESLKGLLPIPSRTPLDLAEGEFSPGMVTIPKLEYIQLRHDVGTWKSRHCLAVEREEVLKADIAGLRAQIIDLKQRLFGRKTEKHNRGNESGEKDKTGRKRGQQKGNDGHGRTLPDLPVEDEYVDLPEDRKVCQVCGQAHKEFPLTLDSGVVEIEVRGYIRRYRRRQYVPGCQCEGLAGLVAAPAPNRLIDRGKHGISLWVEILLNKYLYGNPTNRLLQSLKDRGIPLSQGAVTGGLEKLVPLFEPFLDAVSDKVLSENYWNVDETYYKVFAQIEGKAGHDWLLWIFRSRSAVIYILDPSRSSEVPQAFFGDTAEGTVICDRHSAYKKLEKDLIKIILAFCWAHVRRDFLDLGRSLPELASWCDGWVERIGVLYHLNRLRLEGAEDEDLYKIRNRELCISLSEMKKVRDKELKDGSLHEKSRKVLKSLKNHWKGLTRFVGNPEIPMDNNRAENAGRGPKVGAKGYYGAGEVWSGRFAAMMFSILMTVKYAGLNPRLWLNAYLEACAKNGNRAPEELKSFLPWSMNEQRSEELKKSGLRPPLPT